MVEIGLTFPGVLLNAFEGKGNPAGIGQTGELGDVPNPCAFIRFPGLSSIKYTHSDGFGPPVKNTVSSVPPAVTGKE